MTTRLLRWFVLGVLAEVPALSQTTARAVNAILQDKILPPEVATFQLRDYVVRRAKSPPEVQGPMGLGAISSACQGRRFSPVVALSKIQLRTLNAPQLRAIEQGDASHHQSSGSRTARRAF